MSEAGLVLTGDKVFLTSFTEADISDAYLGWLNDPLVTRFSNQRFLSHDRASARRYLHSFTGTPNLFLSIRRHSDGRPIGTTTAYVAPHHGTSDIGILLGDRAAWGQGFALDAWTTLADHLASLPGMRKITAGSLECNRAMVRLAERAGMSLEARRTAHELVDGAPVDILYFARFVG